MIVTPATSIMIKQGPCRVCRTGTAPEWEIVQGVVDLDDENSFEDWLADMLEMGRYTEIDKDGE